MTDVQKLLADYVQNGSEAAFREIVARYINLVYAAALRMVDGDSHLAQDVAQTVFIDLARQARGFSGNILLGGWLHRHTCFVAAKVIRSNRRRQIREKQAVAMNLQPDHSGENLAQIAPVLDEAINQLGESDRMAILLRYFEQQDLRTVGEALGASENAAQKRVARALDDLRGALSRRGVAFSGAGLATVLAGGGITAAPAGLAVSVSSAALAGAAVGGGTGLTLLNLMTMTKIKAAAIGVVAVAGVATPLVVQHRTQTALREENHELRQRVAQLNQFNAESGRLLGQLTNHTRLSQDQLNDLMRLRAELAALRRQTNEFGRLREENQQLKAALRHSIPDPAAGEPAAEALKREGLAKMTYARNWMMALYLYADKNDGQIPETFEQALSFLPAPAAGGEGDPGADAHLAAQLTPDHYEIVYRGSLSSLSSPGSTIVIREREAWPNPKGGWNRTYGFADGHSEIHRSDEINAEAWEKERMASSPGSGPAGSVQ